MMTKNKRNVLIITGRYLPGYKDGGPVRSIKNLVDYLGDQYNFKILTCDRDHGDTEAYSNVKVHDWNQVGGAQVYYVPPKGFTFRIIKKLASQVDLVYVCGCFSDYAINTLLLKRIGLIKKPVFVAAMGLFSPMEFRLKYKKKKLFTTLFNLTGIFKNIHWSATSEMEVNEISQQVRTYGNFIIAEDLPRRVEDTPINKRKEEGDLKVVWISRIAPKKNLIGAIQVLKRVRSNIEFTIYGPIHEPNYWEECQAELQLLPPNVSWTYAGNVESEQVVETLREHHLFLFPTLGENYGHVIQEALSAGCYTLLSDQTPWQDLNKYGAGKVFRVDDIQRFVNEIDGYAQLNHEEFSSKTKDVIAYVMNNNKLKVSGTGYHHIFGRGVVQ
ncbi:glycosyltransferase family 4 protein [Paenibacillus sp. MWE-103]|uniref:Glycosyltransferase family 4 protein n=1 Tax=Paenibacillus artemisiicola TaxID=1172618 RepID=A0ABS3WHN5_9BACL|nr:glycosyltransferase family 4 protein [Paenibacillus artemisiicola]MBO7747810.1 glycosyltransferase family 4 protein [Paenibacillus artemisiicola]